MEEYYNFKETKQFKINPEDKEKYIVITCAKQENEYIKEWIDYHLNLGFDKIFIADNNDDDSLSELLSEYINNGQVEIFDMHGESLFMSKYYNMFTQIGNYKWAAIIDVDEFIELNAYDNIKDFLKTKEDKDYIELNWVMYSNDGKISKETGKVQDRFIYPLPLLSQENFTKKTIVNGKFKTWYHIHTISDNPSSLFCKEIDYTEAYIKHYKYKSVEEQYAIKYRGSGCMYRYIMDILNFNEIKDYHNLLLKIVDMRHMIEEQHEEEIKKYSVILYNIQSESFLYHTQQIILKDMISTTGKIFAINYKNWQNIPTSLFNCYFEYALHTGNKVCITFPNINNMNFDYLYYNYD